MTSPDDLATSGGALLVAWLAVVVVLTVLAGVLELRDRRRRKLAAAPAQIRESNVVSMRDWRDRRELIEQLEVRDSYWRARQ